MAHEAPEHSDHGAFKGRQIGRFVSPLREKERMRVGIKVSRVSTLPFEAPSSSIGPQMVVFILSIVAESLPILHLASSLKGGTKVLAHEAPEHSDYGAFKGR